MQLFSGSYSPDDVIFLLKPIDINPTDIVEKERRIQSGQYHYSEMISQEYQVSDKYLKVFYDSVNRNKQLMALHLIQLSQLISQDISGPITIVSLARAGTPVGVLLKRILSTYFHKTVTHYSISIIRDRGIDANALLYILHQAHHAPESIIFVDGWTGKGVIAQELKKAIMEFNALYNMHLSNRLYVLSDLCGCADISASCLDYLIPSSILNATISGLVSRSILNSQYIEANDFHGCVYYWQLKEADLSNWFIDAIIDEIQRINETTAINSITAQSISEDQKKALQEKSKQFIQDAMKTYGVNHIHYIKPGIGEATRVLLRRVPDQLIIQDNQIEDVQHLIVLAKEKHIPIITDTALPYRAAALIQQISK
ncbi:MAG: cysteine protease StiP family protein [Desulfobacterales bacterium]|nr:cysteine protease StiP family protein [Desulfobacterales bacterium]